VPSLVNIKAILDIIDVLSWSRAGQKRLALSAENAP
jgi:hypothetical protein